MGAVIVEGPMNEVREKYKRIVLKIFVVKATETVHAKLSRAMPGLVSFIYDLLQVKLIDTDTIIGL